VIDTHRRSLLEVVPSSNQFKHVNVSQNCRKSCLCIRRYYFSAIKFCSIASELKSETDQ
jgi:hypothetical protein